MTKYTLAFILIVVLIIGFSWLGSNFDDPRVAYHTETKR